MKKSQKIDIFPLQNNYFIIYYIRLEMCLAQGKQNETYYVKEGINVKETKKTKNKTTKSN